MLSRRGLYLIQAIVLVYATIVLTTNLVVDLLYSWLDLEDPLCSEISSSALSRADLPSQVVESSAVVPTLRAFARKQPLGMLVAACSISLSAWPHAPPHAV